MRDEQHAHDAGKRPQRRFREVDCEWCGKPLVGDETVRYYREPPLLCGRCFDRWRRLGW